MYMKAVAVTAPASFRTNFDVLMSGRGLACTVTTYGLCSLHRSRQSPGLCNGMV